MSSWSEVPSGFPNEPRPKAAIFLPPLMVERNVLGSNLMCFSGATTTLMIEPPLKCARRTAEDEQMRENGEGTTAIRLK